MKNKNRDFNVQFATQRLRENVTNAGGATATPGTGEQYFARGKKIRETIKKVDGKYAVYPEKGGSRLGTHDTKEKAQKQLAAIEISKQQKEAKERGTGKGLIYVDLWEMFSEEEADPKEGDSVKIQKKGSPQDGKIGKIVSITEPGAYNIDFNGKVYTFQETDFVIDKSAEDQPEETGEENAEEPVSEGLGAPGMNVGTVGLGGGRKGIYFITDKGKFVYEPNPLEYEAFELSGGKVRMLLAKSWFPKAKPWEEKPNPMASLGQGKGHHIDEELNENYSRFKKETKTRTNEQQLHAAMRLAEKKIHEANRILEYTSQLRGELNETKVNKNIKRIMEKITVGIAEAYSKMKKIKR
jgi:hypothetical protein